MQIYLKAVDYDENNNYQNIDNIIDAYDTPTHAWFHHPINDNIPYVQPRLTVPYGYEYPEFEFTKLPENHDYVNVIRNDFALDGRFALCGIPSKNFLDSKQFLINQRHEDFALFFIEYILIDQTGHRVVLSNLEERRDDIIDKAARFHGEENAYYFLGLPQLTLQGRIPLDMMETIEGLIEIEAFVLNFPVSV